MDGDWEQITPRFAWCRRTGCLRIGTWCGKECIDDEGVPIKMTSTGYYHPSLGWQPGPVPGEFHRDVYGEPYTYRKPGGSS